MPPMDVVLCWHMHQPDYRLEGQYLRPWTWLHAIKDYSDMAAHLEAHPGARAVVNFSPVLIEQLRDYPRRVERYLERGAAIGDGVLDALGGHEAAYSRELLAQLLRVNEQRMKDRFPPYAALYEKAQATLAGSGGLKYGEVNDLLVWYAIAWMGESLRSHPLVQALSHKAHGFSAGDRRALMMFVRAVIDDILPRYRRLAEAGRVELSVTPFAHPILPLLLDPESAHDAMPAAPLPELGYPGGAERCDWHLNEARCVFLDAFGMEPAGCWPSEGGVSDESLTMMARHHFRWTASGSAVLSNSLEAARSQQGKPDAEGPAHLVPWVIENGESPACFFRDDGLSDLIGFEYSKWQADHAVEHFIQKLLERRQQAISAGNELPVLAIIMDGENAWEYYPENGQAFLGELYGRLAEHPDLRLATFSEVLDRVEPRSLPGLRAGSWVYGDFSTWIGEPEKNRAWELLDAAQAAVAGSGMSQDHGVLRQLAICEASDWFWWLGEEVTLQDAGVFDAIFRSQLAALYRMIGADPPESLEQPIHAGGEPAGESDRQGAMRRSG